MTELMTPAEVSAHLHTPYKTLEYWRSHGKGPRYARIGRRVLYRRTDVESWLTGVFESAQLRAFVMFVTFACIFPYKPVKSPNLW